LINYPVRDYLELPDLLRNFDKNPLSKYEYFYNPSDYEIKNPLYYSKLIATFLTIIDYLQNKDTEDVDFYKKGSPESELCYSIIKKFVREASQESAVYIVHLPKKEYLIELLSEKPVTEKILFYEPLLLRLKEDFAVLDPTNDLIAEAEETSLDKLFVGHYSGRANEIIANIIYTSLLSENVKVLQRGIIKHG
jgi:hypothetical protein